MILNIRIDHKTADINKIEESTTTMEDIFAKIQKEHQVQEFIQLKTCNRAEIYLVMDEAPLDYHWNGLVVEKDEKALEHVLKLSCGLESMIIGEDQILGQLKDAYKVSVKTDCCGQVLSTVFTKAIHVGQSVRKKTRINQGSVSIGSAAVNLAESVLGNLKCKKVLVIGAGKMGTLVAKALVEKHLQAIVVANRTYDRAVCLAKELGGSAIHFDSLSQAMSDADVVISATGAPHNILTQEKVSEAVPPEHLQTMVMIDIANPRDIEEEVAQLGVKLYNIDDLRGIADKNKKIRETEAKEAEKIIADELELLEKSLRHLEVEPVIAQIRAQAETIRMRETQKAFRKLGDMNGKEKVVDDLTKVVVDRVFLDIIHNLKEAAENNNKDVLNTAKYIFKNKN
ncbi:MULTISPECIES: glutamyl-tRNA reductase [Methanobacterium]|uniref:Glutamyl-tRNA reductase n=1 Tax=Methanobacterium formicicum TaxID=2162 RepID=A0A090I9B0_METFO|nr:MULTISPECIES: glutamyl-tRNA reductase [Methanobacterium]AIS32908.1 glutamyl-tRNA reductase HemA [Methanobacterium formicicum]KUK75410.1 MAG: Glutamyl-tRNA reductase [Methanobacterium sp. 42_16]MBF4475164.1 glutamyl-tRNA reductase [Methanobacterium formicicum]MDD4810578.1 glutamyl-tRNA reductase [Methanobacterium formicicum]MDG3546816.1 glutamyl-tRNA reductase [Methanobacterium formicicum]